MHPQEKRAIRIPMSDEVPGYRKRELRVVMVGAGINPKANQHKLQRIEEIG